MAAFINGIASHIVAFDDIFRPGCPGCPGDCGHADGGTRRGCERGDQFKRAVVAGYVVSTRLGAAVAAVRDRFWHATGTVGTFGAAPCAHLLAQVGRLQEASPDEISRLGVRVG